jgi:hypothetical protein
MNLERHAAQGMNNFFAHHVILRDVLDIDDDRTDGPQIIGVHFVL